MIGIIGASTSGLFCAYLLAKGGLKISVFEKQKTVGLPKRTLIVTPEITKILGFAPKTAIVNQIKKIELFSRNQKAVIELEQPDIILDREKLIKILANKARSLGVEIKLGFELLAFQKKPKELILKVRNKKGKVEKLRVDILIGADGVNSRVKKGLGIKNQTALALIQSRVNLQGDNGQKVQIWFDARRTKYFFWLIPESQKTAVIGLIDESPEKAERNLSSFLKKQGLNSQNFQSGIVPFYRPNSNISNQNIFLIGDAASQVKNTTVGGTVTGLRGARALAEAIIPGQNYSQTLKGLNRELFSHYLIRRVLNKFTNKDYNELLGFLDKRTKDILTQYNRDEVVKGIFKVLATQPRFLPFALKAL
jgi:digeranylgeranylglycerophospholipid reductase